MKLLAFWLCVFSATVFASAKEQSGLSQEIQKKHQQVVQLRENILKGNSGADVSFGDDKRSWGGARCYSLQCRGGIGRPG